MGLSYKAGRCFRRADTNSVDASPEKGTLALEQEDGLLHVTWAARPAGGAAVLDLIVFPGDAVFGKVAQSADDHVYALTFSHTAETHFFWFQGEGADYAAQAEHINATIADPSFVAPAPLSASVGAAAASSSSSSGLPPPATPAHQATSSAAPPAAPNPTRTVGFDLGGAGSGSSSYSPAQLEQLRSMLEAQVASEGGTGAADSDVHLQDILTPQLLAPLFSSPDLLRSLVPSLPSDLPISSPPTAAEMTAVVESAQFQDGVRGLDRALRTGLLGGLVQGLGLPEGAGTSVEAFLRAIGEQAGQGEGGAADEGGQMDVTN